MSYFTAENLLTRIDGHHEVIRGLRKEIEKQNDAISHYKGCLNLVRPLINTLLPKELLAEIFREYMLICTPPGYHEMSMTASHDLDHPPYEWLKVAHVCRYWRSIALSHATLFAYVLLNRPLSKSRTEVAKEWLSHSGVAPIHTVGVLNENGPLWEPIIEHLPHIVNLDILLPNSQSEVSWPVSPLMKTVSCKLPEDEETRQLESNILDKFLGCLQSLESLAIDTASCQAIDWTRSPLPPSLRKLKVRSWTVLDADDVNRLISMLAKLTSLGTLEMEKLLPLISDPIVGPELPVTKPTIRVLRLSGGIIPVITITKLIACSHIIQISIDTILGDDTENAALFRTFFETLASEYQTHFLSLRHAKLEVGWSRHRRTYLVNFKGWPLRYSCVNKESPSVDITVYAEDRGRLHELVNILCDTIYPSLDSLESLNIVLSHNNFDRDDEVIVTSCCHQLQGLRTLHLDAERSLLFAFMTSIGSRHGDILFPNLDSLHVICYNRRGFTAGHILRTRDLLTRRARRDAKPLEHLTLESIEEKEQWINTEIEEELEMLRELVGSLTIIGEGKGSSD
ncbi:hypothetical protein QCA50_010900 [Cerrena zonata]|uniref:F-box domain-containing protein n=1 Tax=Cerrena zonata TaxID=2478898 RepID=A0AAW0G7V8_9APHY